MRPFRKKKINNCKVIAELCYCLQSILAVGIPLVEREEWLDYYKLLGWGILVMSIISVFMELIALIFTKKFKEVKMSRRKKKDKDKFNLKNSYRLNLKNYKS